MLYNEIRLINYDIDKMDLRDIKKRIEELIRDLKEYKYNNNTDDFTEKAIYNLILKLDRFDILSYSMYELKEFINEIYIILKFINI